MCWPTSIFDGGSISQEDRALALQRQSLRQRHLPGSDDGVGEDPLALVDGGGATSTSRGGEGEEPRALSSYQTFRERQDGISCTLEAPAGPIRLEVGVDAEVLDKILHEIEVRDQHGPCTFVLIFLVRFLTVVSRNIL